MSVETSVTNQTGNLTATKKLTREQLWSRLFPYLLVAPTLLLVMLFTLYPAMMTVVDSMRQPGLIAGDAPVWVGLQNFADLFNPNHYLGTRFLQTLGNTILFSGATVFFGVPLSLLFAIILNQKLRLLGFLRFSIFYPALLPLLGAASIWSFLYSDSIGLFNAVLHTLGLSGVNWLGDPNVILPAIIIFNIWKQSSYYMIFFLSGLQDIPVDVYEASSLDGANWWQNLLYITMPLLRRTILFVMVVSFTYAFQTVEQLQVLNMGNPADRGNLQLYLIFQNISVRNNWGHVNAMTLVLIGIVLIFTVSNFVFFERNDDDA